MLIVSLIMIIRLKCPTGLMPLSDNYNTAADRWMLTNAGRLISFYEVATLFRDAYDKTATTAKASSGFCCTGIWPFNPDVSRQVWSQFA